MRPTLRGSLLAATLLVAVVPARVLAGDPLSSAERAALGARADTSLEALRGGLRAEAALDEGERELLEAAQAATPDLQDEHAAFGLSEHDLIIIAVTVVAIAVLIIIF
jgi:hypothetical protein